MRSARTLVVVAALFTALFHGTGCGSGSDSDGAGTGGSDAGLGGGGAGGEGPSDGGEAGAGGEGATGAGGGDDDHGTWTDPHTGLVWLNPSSPDPMNWSSSKSFCERLEVAGHDDWRLPSAEELRSLVRGCPDSEWDLLDPPESWCEWNEDQTDTNCNGCDDSEGPAEGCYWPDELRGPCAAYFTSSRTGAATTAENDFAWAIDFRTGRVYRGLVQRDWRTSSFQRNPVRCVRGTADLPEAE